MHQVKPQLSDSRDTNGNPKGLKALRDRLRKRFAPVLRITANEEQVGVGDVDQSWSYNDLVPWFVLMGVSLLVVGMIAAASLALVIDAKADRQAEQQYRKEQLDLAIRVAKAETESKLAPAISKLQTDMARAMQDAAQAKDWTDQKNTELKTLRGSK